MTSLDYCLIGKLIGTDTQAFHPYLLKLLKNVSAPLLYRLDRAIRLFSGAEPYLARSTSLHALFRVAKVALVVSYIRERLVLGMAFPHLKAGVFSSFLKEKDV